VKRGLSSPVELPPFGGTSWRGAVWPVLVVVLGVDAYHSLEVSAPQDEDAIEAVGADSAYPALGEGACVRRLEWSPDHLDPFGAEDFVEGAAELCVAVMDQQLEAALLLAQLHDEVASLLGLPTPGAEAPDSAWPAGRDRPVRSAAGLTGAARPRARDATPRSPAPSIDPCAQEAAGARTGFVPRDRQKTRPPTTSDSTTETRG
jgi:hypothetical protein